MVLLLRKCMAHPGGAHSVPDSESKRTEALSRLSYLDRQYEALPPTVNHHTNSNQCRAVKQILLFIMGYNPFLGKFLKSHTLYSLQSGE